MKIIRFVASVLFALCLSLSLPAHAGLGWATVTAPAAADIAAGGGKVWIIGTDGAIYRHDPTGPIPWVKVIGSGTRIAVDWEGDPWVVNSAGNLLQRKSDGTWQTMPALPAGKVADVGIGKNNGIWVTTTDMALYAWVKSSNTLQAASYPTTGEWKQAPGGGGVRVAVDGSGNPWVVDATGAAHSFYLPNGTWIPLSGAATVRDLGNGDDGSMWAVTAGVGKWNGSSWTQYSGVGYGLSLVVVSGFPWLLNNAGVISRQEQLSSGTLEFKGFGTNVVSCPYEETSVDVYTVNCQGMQPFTNLRGIITSSRKYRLSTSVSDLKAMFSGNAAVQSVFSQNLFAGLGKGTIEFFGPDQPFALFDQGTLDVVFRGNASVNWNAFSPLNEAIAGITDMSLPTTSIPVVVTLYAGHVLAVATLRDSAKQSPTVLTTPTGQTFRMKDLDLRYRKTPTGTPTLSAEAVTDFRLSSAESYANLDLTFAKQGTDVIPSGTLVNLNNPFGVLPISVKKGWVKGRLKQAGTKRNLVALDVDVKDGTLGLPDPINAGVALTGKFGFDMEAPSFYVNTYINVCNVRQNVDINSDKPEQIPVALAELVGQLAGSCANPGNWF